MCRRRQKSMICRLVTILLAPMAKLTILNKRLRDRGRRSGPPTVNNAPVPPVGWLNALRSKCEP